MKRESIEKLMPIGITILMIGALISNFLMINPVEASLKSFKSYDELEEFVKSRLEAHRNRYDFIEDVYSVNDVRTFSKSLTPDYSITNVQVAGVDEADIVKTDGNYIYLISKGKVYIIKANPLEIASEMTIDGNPIGLFVNRDRLVIFKYEERLFKYHQESLKMVLPKPWSRGISIEVYDISSINNPTLVKKVYLNGDYIDSRMIEDCVYVVASQPMFELLSEKVIHPSIVFNDYTEKIPPTKIYYSNETAIPSCYTVVIAMNIFNDEMPECKAILTGYASCIYVSSSNIYITMPKWRIESTEIHRVGISGSKIAVEASGEVPGRVLNQFSMDEHKGYFRIATTTGRFTRFLGGSDNISNNVYVLDVENLKIVGKIEDLAPGESIYSARFMGDKCYLVTFKKIDPLFTIDLSNPKAPRVLGELKISGYSNYLHPYDENHLIGIGKEAIPADEGDFAWHQGVKISLFDVSNITNPREVDSIVIGDRGSDSLVLRDHHAFLLDKKRNLLVIPILEAKIFPERYAGSVPPWAYGECVFQGVYVFHVSSEDGIDIKGKITHVEDQALLRSGSHFEIKRSLIIGDVLYTISDGKVKANSLINLLEICEIKLSNTTTP